MKEETFPILTKGGPLDGKSLLVQRSVFGWPPPVNLPGIFHGGVYLRNEFSDAPARHAEYVWVGYLKGTNVFAK